MAYKKTLAENHLSELANQGRGGDTELAHVNPQEKSMLKAMGGSGGINPKTGLREYQNIRRVSSPIMGNLSPVSPIQAPAAGGFMAGASAALPWVGLALSLFGGISSAKGARTAARNESKILGNQLVELQEQEEKLGPARLAEEKVAGVGFQQQTKALGMTEEDIKKKTNLVRSSGAEEVLSQKEESIWGDLGKTMSGIMEKFTENKTRIQSLMKSVTFQKEAADKAAEQKYLGIF